jgi:hypothetical protein
MTNGFIDHLYTQLATTIITALSLISAFYDSPQHPLKDIIQPAVSSSAVFWQGFLTVEILQLHTLRFYLHSLPYRTKFSIDN